MKQPGDSSSGQPGFMQTYPVSWPLLTERRQRQPANIDNKGEERCEVFCLEICLCWQPDLACLVTVTQAWPHLTLLWAVIGPRLGSADVRDLLPRRQAECGHCSAGGAVEQWSSQTTTTLAPWLSD